MRRPVSFGASVRTTVSTSGSSGMRFGVQKNVAAFSFDREALELDRRIEIVFAGAAVVSPFMPGTHEHMVLKIALTEGTSRVRADSGKRVQFSVRIADRVRVFAERNLCHRAGRERREGTNLHESHPTTYVTVTVYADLRRDFDWSFFSSECRLRSDTSAFPARRMV